MSELIDVTVSLREGLPTWPSSPGFGLITESWMEDGDLVTNSSITSDVHVGTHLDAPAHFLRAGATVEELGLNPLIGPVDVVRVADSVDIINANVLREIAVPNDVERLLLKTANERWWPESDGFIEDYVALDETGARWCVERGLVLVGIDYMSIQARGASTETHRSLMRAGIAVVEGLDLRDVTPGRYQLICLPMRIAGAEAAPVRAVLRPPQCEVRS